MTHTECRICFDDGTEEALISPCAGCRGSSAFVHLSCLVSYYRATASWCELVCPTCKHDYDGRTAVELGAIGLAAMEEGCGPDDLSLAAMLVNLSNAYGCLGDARHQRALLERALSIEEAEFGPDHCEVAMTLANLSNAYAALGDATKQRSLLERALAIEERHLGPRHPEVAMSLTNLGNAYAAIGDAASQRDLLERALAINEEAYGPRHRLVGITLSNLGCACGCLGDVPRQRDLLEKALAIKEREFGPDHPEVATTLVGLSMARSALNEYASSEEACARALAIGRSCFSPPNALVAEMHMCVALSRFANGAAAATMEQEWQEAVDELRASIGAEDVSAKVTKIIGQAAMFWSAAGRDDIVRWLHSVGSEENVEVNLQMLTENIINDCVQHEGGRPGSPKASKWRVQREIIEPVLFEHAEKQEPQEPCFFSRYQWPFQWSCCVSSDVGGEIRPPNGVPCDGLASI